MGYFRPKRLFQFWLIFSQVLLWACSSPFNDSRSSYLISESEMVIWGKTQSVVGVWHGSPKRIETIVTINVQEVLGQVENIKSLRLVQAGGVVGDTSMIVSDFVFPRIEENDQIILFLIRKGNFAYPRGLITGRSFLEDFYLVGGELEFHEPDLLECHFPGLQVVGNVASRDLRPDFLLRKEGRIRFRNYWSMLETKF